MKQFFKRAAAIAAAAVMTMGVLSGCGSKDDKLTLGTNAAFPPFEFTTTNGVVGNYDGIDICIGKEIAGSMNKELQVEDMEFDGLIAAVKSGKVDMAVAGMTITEERQQSVDFSDTYYTASQVIITKADNTDINSAEDLKNNKTVGVVLGYTGDSIVTEDLAIDDSKITRANRGIDIVQDVKNGKLDAVVIDKATGVALAQKEGLKFVEDPEVFEIEEYAIAVRKDNKELLDQINKVLAEMKESGKIDELSKKYNQE